jgi:hypothetical protein
LCNKWQQWPCSFLWRKEVMSHEAATRLYGYWSICQPIFQIIWIFDLIGNKAMGLKFRGSNTSRGKRFSSALESPGQFLGPPILLLNRYWRLLYLLTHSREQSPLWEANRFAASQEIPRILLNPKVHYRIHNCSPPVSILSQPNPVQTPTSHFLKIHANIMLPSTPGSPQRSLSLRFPLPKPYTRLSLPHPRYMPRLSHSYRFYHPHNIGWGIQIMKLLIMDFSPLYWRLLYWR